MTGIWHKIQNAVATSPSVIKAIFSLLHFLSTTPPQMMDALFWVFGSIRMSKCGKT